MREDFPLDDTSLKSLVVAQHSNLAVEPGVAYSPNQSIEHCFENWLTFLDLWLWLCNLSIHIPGIKEFSI